MRAHGLRGRIRQAQGQGDVGVEIHGQLLPALCRWVKSGADGENVQVFG